MKVRCTRPRETTGGKPKTGLTVGKEYEVLEVLVSPTQGILLRIVGDDRFTPALFSGDLFEVTDQSIPQLWVIARVPTRDGSTLYKMCPKAWLEPGFWERYFDREPEAVAIFDEQRRLLR